MSQQGSSLASKNKIEDMSIIIAEYNSLRDEVSNRLKIRYQLLNLILIIAGTFLTVGLQPNIQASVLFVYPILALFLAIGWVHNGQAMIRAGRYIREHLEARDVGLGWESYIKKQLSESRLAGFLGIVSTSGLVLTTQFLAVGLALLKASFTVTEIVLLLCSIVAIILTMILLRYTYQIWK